MFQKFWSDERGTALVLISIMLPAIIGFALLAIDMSRVNNLHNDLQKAADSFAMAAAAELDGRSDAIARADRALQYLVDNSHRFSDAGIQTVITSSDADISRRFLKSLPADDGTPIAAANVTTLDEEAIYVEVTVKPIGFSAIFPASFLTSDATDNTMQIGATAVAGNAGSVVCQMTPLFMCNPFPLDNLNDVVANEQLYRKGIQLVVGGGGGLWESGNFGFLRPESGHGYGENDLAQDLADGMFSQCVNMRNVYTQTGALSEKVKAAINTRFDLFGPHFSKNSSPPPAQNTRKGYKMKPKPNGTPGTDACDLVPGTDESLYKGFSRDAVHTGRIGNGMWDYEQYIATNNLDLGTDFASYSDTNPPSRYDVYMKEIELSLMPTASAGGETGVPSCYGSHGGPERRRVYAAILDCTDPAVIAELNGQSGAPPAMGFASFFLTEPSVDDIYAEIIDIDGTRGRGTMTNYVRENVQLYR
jgi:hypothetical protein